MNAMLLGLALAVGAPNLKDRPEKGKTGLESSPDKRADLSMFKRVNRE